MIPNFKKKIDNLHISIKVSLVYFMIGMGWILFSDHVLTLLVKNQDMINMVQTIKGVIYVFFTAFVVYISVLKFNATQDVLIKDITASESKYKTLISNLPFPVFQKNENLEYEFANKEYLKLRGLNQDQLKGKTDYDINSKEQADRIRLEDEQVLKGKIITFEDEYDILDKHYELEVIKVPIFIDSEVKGVIGIGIDLTQKREKEREIKKIYTALESMEHGIVISDLNGKIEFANKAYEKMSGYSIDDLIGSSLDIVRSETHTEIFFDELWSTIKNGETWYGEFDNMRKNGEHYWEYNIITGVTDANGVIQNYISFKEDLTAKKEAEKSYLELKVLRDSVIDNTDIWVSAHDDTGKMVLWNTAAEEITGYTSEEAMGFDNIINILFTDPEEARLKDEVFKKILNNKSKIENVVQKITTKSGDLKYISWDVKSLENKGVLKGWVIVMGIDITPRVKAEMDLQSLYDELEDRIEERTLALNEANSELKTSLINLEKKDVELIQMNAQLKESLDNLKNAQEQLIMSENLASLGELVAGVAHEVNTPLGIAVTLSTFIQELHTKLEKQYKTNTIAKVDMDNYLVSGKEAIDLMVINLNRAAELISSFKQVAVDRSTFELRKFDLRDYINEVVKSLEPRLGKTNHTVKVTGDDDLSMVNYPGAFSQIITNLIMNSLIHGFENVEQGHIKIHVERLKDSFLLIYEDDGAGITEDDLNNVFKPFYTTKKNKGSTGLGMHVIYNTVVQVLRGRLELESSIGNGIELRIIVPKLEIEDYVG